MKKSKKKNLTAQVRKRIRRSKNKSPKSCNKWAAKVLVAKKLRSQSSATLRSLRLYRRKKRRRQP